MLDKQLNRRSFASILGAAAGSLGLMSSQSRLPAPWGSLGQGLIQGSGMGTSQSPVNTPTPPLMPEWRAHQLLLKNKQLRDMLTSTMYERYRGQITLDTDLAVLKSFSPMAKQTFQRQRMVERELLQQTEPPQWEIFGPVREFIAKTMWGKL